MCISFGYAQQFEIKGSAKYGYNYTYEHFGTFDVLGSYNHKDFFAVTAGFQANTANLYSGTMELSTKFTIKKGYFKLTNKYVYTALARNKLNQIGMGLFCTYYYNHISVGLGHHVRLFSEMGTPTMYDSYRFIIEPFNVIYLLEVSAMKMDSKWNVGLSFSNLDDFEMERFHQMHYKLFGYYSFNEKLKLWAKFGYKPAGVFNIAVNYWGLDTQIGVNYKF